MKYILPLLASLVLVACVTPGERVMIETPSVAKAGKSVREAKVIAKDIHARGTPAKSPESSTVVKRLEEAEVQLAEAQAKIDAQAEDYSKSLERLNYLEPKYSEAVGILWKWRLICAGLAAAIAVYIGLRMHPATRSFIPCLIAGFLGGFL
jgi:hypothetical protein